MSFLASSYIKAQSLFQPGLCWLFSSLIDIGTQTATMEIMIDPWDPISQKDFKIVEGIWSS